MTNEYEYRFSMFGPDETIELPDGATGVTVTSFGDNAVVKYLVPVEHPEVADHDPPLTDDYLFRRVSTAGVMKVIVTDSADEVYSTNVTGFGVVRPEQSVYEVRL